MTKLEKLKSELSKCQLDIKRLKEKETELENKITLEEQREIQKTMRENDLTYEDLMKLLNQKPNNL